MNALSFIKETHKPYPIPRGIRIKTTDNNGLNYYDYYNLYVRDEKFDDYEYLAKKSSRTLNEYIYRILSYQTSIKHLHSIDIYYKTTTEPLIDKYLKNNKHLLFSLYAHYCVSTNARYSNIYYSQALNNFLVSVQHHFKLDNYDLFNNLVKESLLRIKQEYINSLIETIKEWNIDESVKDDVIKLISDVRINTAEILANYPNHRINNLFSINPIDITPQSLSLYYATTTYSPFTSSRTYLSVLTYNNIFSLINNLKNNLHNLSRNYDREYEDILSNIHRVLKIKDIWVRHSNLIQLTKNINIYITYDKYYNIKLDLSPIYPLFNYDISHLPQQSINYVMDIIFEILTIIFNRLLLKIMSITQEEIYSVYFKNNLKYTNDINDNIELIISHLVLYCISNGVMLLDNCVINDKYFFINKPLVNSTMDDVLDFINKSPEHNINRLYMYLLNINTVIDYDEFMNFFIDKKKEAINNLNIKEKKKKNKMIIRKKSTEPRLKIIGDTKEIFLQNYEHKLSEVRTNVLKNNLEYNGYLRYYKSSMVIIRNKIKNNIDLTDHEIHYYCNRIKLNKSIYYFKQTNEIFYHIDNLFVIFFNKYHDKLRRVMKPALVSFANYSLKFFSTHNHFIRDSIEVKETFNDTITEIFNKVKENCKVNIIVH